MNSCAFSHLKNNTKLWNKTQGLLHTLRESFEQTKPILSSENHKIRVFKSMTNFC